MAKKNNDSVILSLKKELEGKRKALASVGNFRPKTNLVLNLGGGGGVSNLNVLDKVAILLLLSELMSLQRNIKELAFEELEVSGYPLSSWISDLIDKYHVANRKEEEHKLSLLEARLEKLISAELHEKIELENIINSMK